MVPNSLDSWKTRLLKWCVFFGGGVFPILVLLTARAIRPLPNSEQDERQIAVYLAAFLWLVLSGWFIFFRIHTITAGLTSKVIAFFCFSVLLPTVSLVLLGYFALENYSRTIIEDLESHVKSKMRQFDDDFHMEKSSLARNLSTACRIAEKSDPKVWAEIFREFYSTKNGKEVWIVAPNGEIRVPLEFAGSSGVLPQFPTAFLKKTDFAKVDRVASYNALQKTAQPALGEFMEYDWENRSYLLFIEIIKSVPGSDTSILLAALDRNAFEADFCRKNLPAFILLHGFTGTISAFAVASGASHIYVPEENVAKINHFGIPVQPLNRPLVRKTWENGSPWFWMVYPGKAVKSYLLVGNTSLDPLYVSTKMAWVILAVLSLLFLISPIAAGVLLGTHFLVPLKEISTGLRAIQAQDSNHRVPVSTNDEFGDIATLMNKVIENMTDLAVAKTIHDQLFPDCSLELGEFGIYGRSRAVVEVGGDCFDYHVIDESSIFGLLGDVAGHGVSAAMVMTMAKCYFQIRTPEVSDLDELLNELHDYLYKTLRKAKMMTVMIFRLDTKTNTLLVNNAGQTYPCFYKAENQKAAMVELPSLPLGAMKRPLYESIELVLNPGDAFIVCSDGFPEARSQLGEEVGYDRICEWINETGEKNPEGIIEHIWDRLKQFLANATVSDDLTLICLKRVNNSQ